MIRIKEHKNFEKFLKLIERVIKVKKNLPEQVFNQQFSNYLFEEFDWSMTSDFWNEVLKELAVASSDKEIIIAVLDPDPIRYFYETFGEYNVLKLSTNISGQEYWNILKIGPENSEADAILFNSETVIWLPLSMKWAIWGNRSYGVCILAFSDKMLREQASFSTKGWRKADEALKDFIAINFSDEIIPVNFKKIFLRNYSI